MACKLLLLLLLWVIVVVVVIVCSVGWVWSNCSYPYRIVPHMSHKCWVYPWGLLVEALSPAAADA